MLHSTDDLYGRPLGATDGDIGRVEALYFDDEHWAVRHFVVNTGPWLLGRRVLIRPQALVSPVSRDPECLQVRLTRQQVKDSPDVRSCEPVSDRRDAAAYETYGLPVYLAGPPASSLGAYPIVTPPPAASQLDETDEHRGGPDTEHSGGAEIRSAREVAGYDVRAEDGEIGHVDGFLVDDSSWVIRYFVIDTGNWIRGRTVLVALDRLAHVSWSDRAVAVRLPREAIRLAPEYDPRSAVDEDYEGRLAAYYDAARPSLSDHADR